MSADQADDRDKWGYRPGDVVVSQCALCRHLSRVRAPGPDVAACKAFPSEIPDDVLMNRVDHRTPVEGDDGVTFEPADDADPRALATLNRALDALGAGDAP